MQHMAASGPSMRQLFIKKHFHGGCSATANVAQMRAPPVSASLAQPPPCSCTVPGNGPGRQQHLQQQPQQQQHAACQMQQPWQGGHRSTNTANTMAPAPLAAGPGNTMSTSCSTNGGGVHTEQPVRGYGTGGDSTISAAAASRPSNSGPLRDDDEDFMPSKPSRALSQLPAPKPKSASAPGAAACAANPAQQLERHCFQQQQQQSRSMPEARPVGRSGPCCSCVFHTAPCVGLFTT